MTATRRTAAGTVLLGLALGVSSPLAGTAAPAAQPPPSPPAPAAEGLAVPRPDVSSIEATARDKITGMQEVLERLLAEGAADVEVVEAFGYLGQLFHAFRFFDAAEQAYSSSRRLQPDSPRWPFFLGLVRHAKGDLEAAVADYEASLELRGEDDLATLIYLGDALLELHRPQAARDRFAQALELGGDGAAALFGLGRAASQAGEHEEAVRRFEAALERQPEATAIHYPLGQAFRRLGDLDRARHHLGRRGAERPRFPDPLGGQIERLAQMTAFDIVLALAEREAELSEREFLGYALAQLRDASGAAHQLRQGLAADAAAGEAPEPAVEARIRYVLGGLLASEGRDGEAIEELQTAIRLEPRLLDARVILGNALARQGRFDDALTLYDQVLELSPGDEEALLRRAAMLSQLERDREAVAALEDLLARRPAHAEAQIRRAGALDRLGETAAAVDAYRRAEQLDLTSRERAGVHFQLGQLLAREGDLEEALRQLDLALGSDPELTPALAASARLLLALGRHDLAAARFGRLSASQPTDPSHRIGEATSLILSGHHALARERLEEAVARFPDDLRLAAILARHLAACPDRTVRDGARAVALAETLYREELSLENAETLAMAFAEAGRFQEAVELQEEILEWAEANGHDRIARRLRAHRTLYLQGESCCSGGGP